jgi:hypothetical protein
MADVAIFLLERLAPAALRAGAGEQLFTFHAAPLMPGRYGDSERRHIFALVFARLWRSIEANVTHDYWRDYMLETRSK